MQSVQTALTAEAVVKLSTMELRARALVEGHFSGLHRSPYRGAAVEFADHRQYSHGDELRHVDWRVYGRTDRFFVKEYDAETNMCVYLLVDGSNSMGYGSGTVTKLQYATYLAAGLAYLASVQRDAPSLALFDTEVTEQLPALTSSAHLRRLFEVLDSAEAGRETDISQALEQATIALKRRGIVVLLSDLLDDPRHTLRALGYFRHHGHDVIVFHVLDPAELSFDFRGPLTFEDMETGQQMNTDATALRAEYLGQLRRFCGALRDGCMQRHIDYEVMDTSRPFGQALVAYLAKRQRVG